MGKKASSQLDLKIDDGMKINNNILPYTSTLNSKTNMNVIMITGKSWGQRDALPSNKYHVLSRDSSPGPWREDDIEHKIETIEKIRPVTKQDPKIEQPIIDLKFKSLSEATSTIDHSNKSVDDTASIKSVVTLVSKNSLHGLNIRNDIPIVPLDLSQKNIEPIDDKKLVQQNHMKHILNGIFSDYSIFEKSHEKNGRLKETYHKPISLVNVNIKPPDLSPRSSLSIQSGIQRQIWVNLGKGSESDIEKSENIKLPLLNTQKIQNFDYSGDKKSKKKNNVKSASYKTAILVRQFSELDDLIQPSTRSIYEILENHRNSNLSNKSASIESNKADRIYNDINVDQNHVSFIFPNTKFESSIQPIGSSITSDQRRDLEALKLIQKNLKKLSKIQQHEECRKKYKRNLKKKAQLDYKYYRSHKEEVEMIHLPEVSITRDISQINHPPSTIPCLASDGWVDINDIKPPVHKNEEKYDKLPRIASYSNVIGTVSGESSQVKKELEPYKEDERNFLQEQLGTAVHDYLEMMQTKMKYMGYDTSNLDMLCAEKLSLKKLSRHVNSLSNEIDKLILWNKAKEDELQENLRNTNNMRIQERRKMTKSTKQKNSQSDPSLSFNAQNKKKLKKEDGKDRPTKTSLSESVSDEINWSSDDIKMPQNTGFTLKDDSGQVSPTTPQSIKFL